MLRDLGAVLAVLLAVRAVVARVWYINDCDEVYNYWEPLHYLLYGHGFQTWEYAPQYALRSYSFLLPWASLAAPFVSAAAPKVAVFFGVRLAMSAVSAIADASLVVATRRAYGAPASNILLALLCAMPGMMSASVAFLPSSVFMWFVSAAYAAWLTDRVMLAGCTLVAAAVFSWPFAGLVAAPVLLHAIVRVGVAPAFVRTVQTALVTGCIAYVTDTLVYGRPVLAVFNIVRYNVLRGGSELYGVEPWYYYLVTLALQLPAVSWAALASAPLLVVQWGVRSPRVRRTLMFVSPLYIWLGFMSLQAHKEERFMYAVYPIVCLAAAVLVSSLWGSVARRASARAVWVVHPVFVAGVLLCVALGVSRSMALVQHYGGAMRTWQHMSSVELARNAHRNVTVCMGNEWHRFSSSFFLPGEHHRLAFVAADFRGQLPAQFDGVRGASYAVPEMNDRNLEEHSRYVPPSSCTYIVDTLDARQDATAAVPNVREWRAGALPAGVTLTLVHEEPFGVTPDAHVLARLLALPAWAMQALGVRPAQPLGSVAVWRVVTSSA